MAKLSRNPLLSSTVLMACPLASRGGPVLGAPAPVGGTSVRNVIRDGLAERVERCRRDPEFQSMLQRNLQRHRALLDMLADA